MLTVYVTCFARNTEPITTVLCQWTTPWIPTAPPAVQTLQISPRIRLSTFGLPVRSSPLRHHKTVATGANSNIFSSSSNNNILKDHNGRGVISLRSRKK
ncbi:hypothetical protein ACOMHN_028501 [Nucella lapillus]